MSGHHYKELLKGKLKNPRIENDTEIRKRRRIRQSDDTNGNGATSDANAAKQVIIISDESESDESFDSSDFEDVGLDLKEESNRFDLNSDELKNHDDKPETISIAIRQPQENEIKGKRKFSIISREERRSRKMIHQIFVGLMIVHGAIRNKWCNDYGLLMKLKEYASPQVLSLLHQKDSDDILPIVKSRRFLDGVKKLMIMYSNDFRVTSQGLVRKNWNELSIKQPRIEENVTIEKFVSLIGKSRGSRDIGAQGFVSLLRSLGLNARLVFSIQPPDYTMISELPKINPANQDKMSREGGRPESNSLLSKFARLDNKSKLLKSMRKKPTSVTTETRNTNYFEDSDYPIFWVEIWDKFVKKWVSVDPIVLKTIEVAPMRRKSKFEPPSTETRNQLTYVMAYDRLGGVKDVTRRYSQYYNAKTIKKKIQFRSEEEENWYNRIIKASCLSLRKNKLNKIDILELKEFHSRDLAEGIPNNIADFKNHPVYALESQLKQNEIIFPMDESSSCGFFRNKSTGKNKKDQPVIPIYKRSHVYGLRSAKAWYLRGRVLKVGVQPLKHKKKNVMLREATSEDQEEEEEFTRLYAEFQTKLYIPPPIIDGKINKNAYGNIDIYTSSMIPENGYLVKISLKYPIKLVENAAKILDIDYAKAITTFDFGKSEGKKAFNRIPTAREGGILVDIKYKEALLLMMDVLAEEEERLHLQSIELNSLNNWKYFLAKLRISERLNREHGNINKDSKKSDFSDDQLEDEYSLHSDTSGDDAIDNSESGGFIMDDRIDNVYHDQGLDAHESEQRNSEDPPNENENVASNTNNLKLNEENLSEIKSGEGDISGSDEDEIYLLGGGFFVEEDTHHAQDSKYEEIHSSDEIDIPDNLFRKDDDGELVYDPSADKPTTASGNNDVQENVNGLHEMSQYNPSLESIQVTRDLLNNIDSSLAENHATHSSTLGLNSPTEEEESQRMPEGPDIAKEEETFGFEYSESE